jgi:hypothetical protein
MFVSPVPSISSLGVVAERAWVLPLSRAILLAAVHHQLIGVIPDNMPASQLPSSLQCRSCCRAHMFGLVCKSTLIWSCLQINPDLVLSANQPGSQMSLPARTFPTTSHGGLRESSRVLKQLVKRTAVVRTGARTRNIAVRAVQWFKGLASFLQQDNPVA